MTLLWIPGVLAGLALALVGSNQTLNSARALAVRLGLPPFFIGMTIVAFGTDLPEIANSITASATGHGDINVGDSVGSVVTQLTLVAGLLCFVGSMKIDRVTVGVAGLVTVLSLLVGAMLLSDGSLSRTDGLTLLAFWAVGTAAVHRVDRPPIVEQHELFTRKTLLLLRDLSIGLAAVGFGAVVVVLGFTELAAYLGVPEYASSFLVLSIGTSLPELVVDGMALRKGENHIAVGDLVGSSFVDATVSLGIGPALFPVLVSAEAARGSLVASIVCALAIGLLLMRSRHTKVSAPLFLGLYALTYVLVIAP